MHYIFKSSEAILQVFVKKHNILVIFHRKSFPLCIIHGCFWLAVNGERCSSGPAKTDQNKRRWWKDLNFGSTKLYQKANKQTWKRLDTHRNSAMRGRAKARNSLLQRAISLRDWNPFSSSVRTHTGRQRLMCYRALPSEALHKEHELYRLHNHWVWHSFSVRLLSSRCWNGCWKDRVLVLPSSDSHVHTQRLSANPWLFK